MLQEDCILRYKKITNMMKQRKEEVENNHQEAEPIVDNKQNKDIEQDKGSIHSSEIKENNS